MGNGTTDGNVTRLRERVEMPSIEEDGMIVVKDATIVLPETETEFRMDRDETLIRYRQVTSDDPVATRLGGFLESWISRRPQGEDVFESHRVYRLRTRAERWSEDGSGQSRGSSSHEFFLTVPRHAEIERIIARENMVVIESEYQRIRVPIDYGDEEVFEPWRISGIQINWTNSEPRLLTAKVSVHTPQTGRKDFEETASWKPEGLGPHLNVGVSAGGQQVSLYRKADGEAHDRLFGERLGLRLGAYYDYDGIASGPWGVRAGLELELGQMHAASMQRDESRLGATYFEQEASLGLLHDSNGVTLGVHALAGMSEYFVKDDSDAELRIGSAEATIMGARQLSRPYVGGEFSIGHDFMEYGIGVKHAPRTRVQGAMVDYPGVDGIVDDGSETSIEVEVGVNF